jgi:hypothetical protein
MSPWLRLRWPRHTDAECGLPPPHPNPDFRAKSKPRWEESSPCGRDTHRADYVSFILIGLLAIVLSRLWAGPLGFVNPALGLRRRVENVECEGVYGRGTRAQGKVKQIVGSTLKDLNPRCDALPPLPSCAPPAQGTQRPCSERVGGDQGLLKKRCGVSQRKKRDALLPFWRPQPVRAARLTPHRVHDTGLRCECNAYGGIC